MVNSDSDDDLMDQAIDAFYGFDECKEIEAPRPQCEFEIKDVKKERVDFKRESKGTEYSNKHRAKEEERLADRTFNLPSTSNTITIVDSDSESDECVEIKKEIADVADLPELDVYTTYDFNITPQDLPILKKRDEILSHIKHNNILVLTASTGTGKSSQIPQYILEEARKDKQKCNIIVTQPRRIAAITIANRVALERKCDVGTLVGYQVGLDKMMDEKANSDTRILYATTGVLLQKLINEKTMTRYSHVILDEVHERDVDMDMLLIVVRRLFATKNPHVKIILMSATLAVDKIAGYFKIVDHFGERTSAPFLDLNIPRRFQIKLTYLDRLEHLGASRDILNMDKPGITNRMYKLAVEVIRHVLKDSEGKLKPSFLVFLPGIQEIDRMHREILEESTRLESNMKKCRIVKLHSSLTSKEFKEAFNASVDYKIILATNIAESSLTMPSVRFVVDFCLTKYQQTDTATNITQLKLNWASQMSLVQRAGRVGRVEVGQVIRLIFEDQFNNLAVETIPEMMRSSLESVVLKAKRLSEMGKPAEIIGLALDPPEQKAVEDSILVLKEIGGLTRFSKKKRFDPTDGELTLAGAVMARLPLDVRISKLIILGYMFSCLNECIIIGVGFSSKSVFKSNEKKMECYERNVEEAAGSGSDGIAILNAYNKWRNAVKNLKLEGKREQQWCDNRSQQFNLKNLTDMLDMVKDIIKRLNGFQIEVEDKSHLNVEELDEELMFTIKICIAGAFYPNYFGFGGTPPGREECRALNNMNPCTTVFLKGMPPNRIGQIYEKQVRQKLCDENVTDELNEMKVKFDDNSTRLQVEFKPIKTDDVKMVPGDVILEVYKALKLSKIERRMNISIMSRSIEEAFVKDQNIGTWKEGKFVFHKKILQASGLCIYPKVHHERKFHGKVTHIVNCGKFFFQPSKGEALLKKMQGIIVGKCVKMSNLDEALEGYLLLVKHEELYKRAKIIEMPDIDENAANPNYSIFLVDFGNVIEVKMSDLYVCNEPVERQRKEVLQNVFEMPPQCYQCCLSEVIPSALKCSSGWSAKSTGELERFVKNKKVDIIVNSFVDRIASVRLLVPSGAGRLTDFNEHLIIERFAQRSDDSYIRLVDQQRRDTETTKNLNEYESLENELVDENFAAPDDDDLETEVILDGPHSPLEARLEIFCRNDTNAIAPNFSVAPSSVNDVLIDPFPNDPNKKVLVAASMSHNNDRVLLHQTSQMPHAPGMACLLGLIFSPLVQVRSTARKNRYTSILTGLGCNPDNQKPHYGEHDCMFYVDVELDETDFKLINDLRYQMSFLMRSEEYGYKKYSLKEEKRNARVKITQLLKDIFEKERKPLGLSMENCEWDWDSATDGCDVEATYPTVAFEKLLPMSESTKRDLKYHAEELKRKADYNSRDELIKCQLCEESLETLMDLKLHVMKKLHKERILQIREEETSFNEY